jgi:hypothetical protein
LAECSGWVLDGFPCTAAQAVSLITTDIVPTNVISLSGCKRSLILAVPNGEVMYRDDGIPGYVAKEGQKINVAQLFTTVSVGFKDGINHVGAAFEDIPVGNMWVDGERTREATFTNIVNCLDPFVPRASKDILM